MIAKASSISHGAVSINYITRQGNAPVVKLNHLPAEADPQTLWARMKAHRLLSRGSGRPLKNDTIRIEISPARDETADWTLEDWRQLAEQFVRAFDSVRLRQDQGRQRPPCRIAHSQYIVTLHQDSKSGISHLHLDCNRVDMDGKINDDHLIGLRAVAAANAVNRQRGWRQPRDAARENKLRIKDDCLAVLRAMPEFSWDAYVSELRANGHELQLRRDGAGIVRGYTIRTGNSVYKSSEIGRGLVPSQLRQTWEKQHPAKSFEQMTLKEQSDYLLSPAGAQVLFPFRVEVNEKTFDLQVPGKALKVFSNEFRRSDPAYSPEEVRGILKTALLLFAGYVDGATTFAENCGGGGGASHDNDWGRDPKEDDIRWARRCFHHAHELYTTPRKRGMRR